MYACVYVHKKMHTYITVCVYTHAHIYIYTYIFTYLFRIRHQSKSLNAYIECVKYCIMHTAAYI